MNLKQAINVDGKSAKVYYSEDENLSKDSDNWTENISDLSNVKTFKIVPEDNKISTGETLKVSYDLQIPENLGNNESTYTYFPCVYGMGTLCVGSGNNHYIDHEADSRIEKNYIKVFSSTCFLKVKFV